MNSIKTIKESIPKKIFGFRTIALAEILVYCTLVLLYDIYYGSGDRLFSYTLHPFYFLVLLVSVQYGVMEGIAATVISTVFLFSGEIPQQSVDESLFEYQFRLSINPLIWFVSAFVLGEIRMRLDLEKDRYKFEAETLENQSRFISKEYEKLKQTKENLEAHLVGQQQSITNTYKAIRGLEALRPSQILSNLESVVSGALKVKKFSVYASGDNGLEVAQTHGWSDHEKFRIRIICEDPIFEKISVEKKILCVINEHDEQDLGGEGLLAGPLVDPEKDVVFGMLKIEEMNFMDLNLSSIEAFKGLCELIGFAYSNAYRQKDLKSYSIFDNDFPNLLTFHMYERQVEFLKQLCGELDQSLIQIVITFQDRKSSEVEKMLSNELSSAISPVLPKTAQLFLGNRRVGNLLIVLPAADLAKGNDLISIILPIINSHDLLKGNIVTMQLKQLNTIEKKRRSENEQELSKN